MDENFPAYRGSPFIETPLIEVALYTMDMRRLSYTVNSRYNKSDITKSRFSPQSTKCINYYLLITNIGYNEGIYRSQALRYNESSLYDRSVYVHIKAI